MQSHYYPEIKLSSMFYVFSKTEYIEQGMP